jgi:hypothetical protein
MKAATGISNDIQHPETKDSFDEKTAPFVKTVSQDGSTFVQYLMDPQNEEMVKLATEGVVGWLNVGLTAPLRIVESDLICETAIDESGSPGRLSMG